MTDKVQKIRAFLVGIADADGVSTILARAIENKILPYIDSLQEEPVSEELGEEIRNAFIDNKCCVLEDTNLTLGDFKRIAIHFTKWQKERIKEMLSNINLGNNPKERFIKLDLLADIDTLLDKED